MLLLFEIWVVLYTIYHFHASEPHFPLQPASWIIGSLFSGKLIPLKNDRCASFRRIKMPSFHQHVYDMSQELWLHITLTITWARGIVVTKTWLVRTSCDDLLLTVEFLTAPFYHTEVPLFCVKADFYCFVTSEMNRAGKKSIHQSWHHVLLPTLQMRNVNYSSRRAVRNIHQACNLSIPRLKFL